MNMSEQIKQIIDEFVQRARSLYGDRLKCVVVYGSCARDEATAESDIDLAVVLDGAVVPGKEIDRMIDIITDINLEHGVLLSVYPVSEEDYHNRNSPLLINIRREGIPVSQGLEESAGLIAGSICRSLRRRGGDR
jgi:predicted nucleotidyltransferase